MEFKSHRNVLEQWAAHRERDENAGSGKGMREYWRTKNTQSIDGVPGLKFAHETEGELKSVGVPPYARVGGVGEDLSAAGKYSRSVGALADKLGLNVLAEKAVPLVPAVDTHYVLGLLSGAIAALAYVRFVAAHAA